VDGDGYLQGVHGRRAPASTTFGTIMSDGGGDGRVAIAAVGLYCLVGLRNTNKGSSSMHRGVAGTTPYQRWHWPRACTGRCPSSVRHEPATTSWCAAPRLHIFSPSNQDSRGRAIACTYGATDFLSIVCVSWFWLK
jgi:hypothetical protein